ncbi:MAG TPA: hypothetical protein VM537_10090 [Anaerolineae bacterium]|nr:hypothetical protein [Anaerolineae bacterium]
MIGRSRIDISTVPARSRALPSRAFDVLALVGPATWGPMNEATVVIDYPDFYEKFGSYMSAYQACLQAKLFFDSGGRRLVFTRICHITDHSASRTPASAVKATVTLKTDDSVGTYLDTNTLKIDALYYGTRGNSLRIKVQSASNGTAGLFDLLVYENSELLEWFRNLSMLDTDTRYVETVVNTSSEASKFITATDLDAGDPAAVAADQRPENTADDLVNYPYGYASLTTGDDGLASIATADYVGAVSYNTGLFAFSLVEQGDLLICPDDTSTTFQNAAASYCETQKKGKMTFITDPPDSSTKAGIILQAQNLTASEYRSAILWPRVKISNPSTSIYGQAPQIEVCPSGMYCGRIARNSLTEESSYGTQPMNEVYGLLDYAVDLETTQHEVLEDTVRDYVTDFGVNPIIKGTRATDGNFGVWVDDCLLGKTSDNFKSVGEQRFVTYLRIIFEAYLQRHRGQNNTPARRRTIGEAFESELSKWLGKGVYASDSAAEAFYVNTDPEGESLNNPQVQDEMRMRILVGVATARPGRFIQLMFTRDNRAVESYIQQQLTASSQA